MANRSNKRSKRFPDLFKVYLPRKPKGIGCKKRTLIEEMKVENDEEEEEEEYQDDSNNSASDKDYVEEEKEEEVTDKGRGEKKISAGKEGSGERAAGRAGRSKSTNDFKRKERTVFQHGNPYFVAKAGPEDWKSLRVPTNVLKDFGLELAQKIILPSEQG